MRSFSTPYRRPPKKQLNPHVGPRRPVITALRRKIINAIAEGIRDEDGVLIRWLHVYEIIERVNKDCNRVAMLATLAPMCEQGLIYRTSRVLLETLDGRRWYTLYAPTDWTLDNLNKILNVREKVYVPIFQELPEDEAGIIVMEGFEEPELPELDD